MALDWLWDTFAPILALCMALTMWLSPLPEVLNVRRRNRMHDLNPLPFGFVYCNCWGWSLYGWLSSDYYICTANFPGAAISAFCLSTCIHVLGYELALLENSPELWNIKDNEDDSDDDKFQLGKESEGKTLIGSAEASTSSEGASQNQSITIEGLIAKKRRERDILTGFMWGGAVLWGFLGTICFTYMNVNDKSATGLLVVGIVCGIFAMSYFASPMTTMLEVIKQRDASSLYPPMVIANIVNCFCWVIYGLMALDDPIIYGQNGAGMALNVANLVLVMVFPRTRANALVQQEAEKKKKQMTADAAGEAATASTHPPPPPTAQGLEIA